MGKAWEPLLLCHLVQFNVQLRLQTIVTGHKKENPPSIGRLLPNELRYHHVVSSQLNC